MASRLKDMIPHGKIEKAASNFDPDQFGKEHGLSKEVMDELTQDREVESVRRAEREPIIDFVENKVCPRPHA